MQKQKSKWNNDGVDVVTQQKLNGCFDLAVVILVGVLSDIQDAYQFRVGIGMLEVN